MSGINSVSFGSREKDAFKTAVATQTNVDTNKVVITSVQDASRRRLLNAQQLGSAGVVVTFDVLLRVQSADPTVVANANVALTTLLSQAVSSGDFSSTLALVSGQLGATGLSSATVSSSLTTLQVPSDLDYTGYGIVSTYFSSKNCTGSFRSKSTVVKFGQCAKTYESGYVGKYSKRGWKVDGNQYLAYSIFYSDSACSIVYNYEFSSFPSICHNDQYGGSSKYEVSSVQPAPESGGYFQSVYTNKTKCLTNDVTDVYQTVVVNGACRLTHTSQYNQTSSSSCVSNGDGSLNITNYRVVSSPSGYYQQKSVSKMVNDCKTQSRYTCPPIGSPSATFCPVPNPFAAQMIVKGFIKVTAFYTPDCSGPLSATAYVRLGGCNERSSQNPSNWGALSYGVITRGYQAYLYGNFYDITDGMCKQSPVASLSTSANFTVATCSQNSFLKSAIGGGDMQKTVVIPTGDMQKAVVIPTLDASFPNGGALLRVFQSEADYNKGPGHEFLIIAFDLNCNRNRDAATGKLVSQKLSCTTLANGDVSATMSYFDNEVCSGNPVGGLSSFQTSKSSLSTWQCFAPSPSSVPATSELSTAATIGIAVGVAVGVVLIAVAVFIGVMSCKKKPPVYVVNN